MSSICRVEIGSTGEPQPLLSVLRLLDVAVLYGGDNATLTGRLITQAFQLHASLAGELSQVAEATAQNIGDVCTTCTARAQSVTLLQPSVVKDLSDGAVYLRDVCLTLSAFLRAAPATAALIVGDSGRNLAALAPLHDELLPALESAAHRQKPPASEMLRVVGHLRLAAVQLAALLLQDACLLAHDALPGTSATDPVARGELLLTSLIALGPIDGGASSGCLTAVSQRLSLPAGVAAAAAHGVLAVDSAQRDYLSALLGGPLPEPPQVQQLAAHHSGGDSVPEEDLQAAQRALPLIKDVLPDFGDGFLTAALLHYGNASERVINALLEGSLPPQLAALDSQAATLPRGFVTHPGEAVTGQTSQAGRTDVSSKATWQGLAAEAVVNEREASGPCRLPPQPSVAPRQKPAHRATARALDRTDATTRGAIRAAAHAAQWDDDEDDDGGGGYGGNAYGGSRGGGGEYDDEYDDSFDAYGGGAADGVADAEGEEQEATRGGSSASSASDWSREQSRGGGRRDPSGGIHTGRGGPSKSRPPMLQQQQQQSSGQQLQRQPKQQQQQSTAAAVAAAQAALAPWRNQTQGHPPAQQQNQQQQARCQQQQHNQQQQRPAKPRKAWIKDGKVYNYAKEGATLVDGPSAARTAAAGAAQAAAEIHGLGRGGNVPHQQWSNTDDVGAPEGEAGSGAGPGRGGGHGGEGTKAEHLRKDQRKASVANHHRKERAARKQGMF